MKVEVRQSSFYSGDQFYEDQALPIRILHIENSPSYPRHRHDFDELVIVNKGTGDHFIDDNEYKIVEGDVYYIPKGISHEYRRPDQLHYINIIFDIEAFSKEIHWYSQISGLNLDKFFSHAGLKFRLTLLGVRQVSDLINIIDSELLWRDALYHSMIKNKFVELWLVLQRCSLEQSLPEEMSTISRVQRVIKTMIKNPSMSLSIEDMATEAHTCVRNFHRVFRSLVGDSPQSYMIHLRIEKSCELLAETEKTVTQIATLVGFDDSNYFSRRFKVEKGCTPLEYRLRKRLPGTS